MFFSILALATLATASLAAPAPAPAANAVPYNCVSLGKTSLGYNPSNISIYELHAPMLWLTLVGDADAAGNKQLQRGRYVPEQFELFNCKTTLNPQGGKGATDAYDGFITSAATGECLTISQLGQKGAHFAAKPCNFSSGGIAKHQHFQFQRNTFYNYYLIDFIGAASGPTSKATSSFQSGQGGYHYHIDGRVVDADYAPDAPFDRAQQIIADNHNYNIQL